MKLLRNVLGILLISLVIAGLFFIFWDFPDIKLLLKVFLFPGVLFIVLGGLFYDWFDRKLFAKMQNRVGPRFLQPVYDLLKLLAKEDITPDGVDTPEFDWLPAIQLMLAIIVAFTVPVYISAGFIAFEGDIVFILFLLALIGGCVFLIGWSSNNPYATIGASRAAVAEFSFEIPLGLAFIGPAIIAGSLSVSKIITSKISLIDIPIRLFTETGYEFENILLLIPLVLLFFLAINGATAVLEKVPFDPAHAEVEIVGGWSVEITGKKLLFTKLANFILEFSLAGLIAAIFLGGPNLAIETGTFDIMYIGNIILFAIKTSFVVFCITLMRTLHSRIRIDQLVHYFWRYYLPMGLLSIFLIVLFLGVI